MILSQSAQVLLSALLPLAGGLRRKELHNDYHYYFYWIVFEFYSS